MSRRIVLVGHCGPDSYMLRSAVKYAVKDSQVDMISDEKRLEKVITEGASLLLVNRMLDGTFAEREGVALIKRLHETYPNVATMLISNYADSQAEAEAAGAMPGFGKSQIGSPKMRDALAGVFA